MELLRIHGSGDVRLDPYERPATGPLDVVVKMKSVGICGSDLSYIKIGGIPTPGTLTALGHEGAGEVIEVGAGVEGIAVGDPVVVNPMMTPGNIGSGGPEGAFTQELLVREARLGDRSCRSPTASTTMSPPCASRLPSPCTGSIGPR
ncbi:alcohol dehydrogenase catalytic domain-containing protein [Novosphingobium resinovorum]